MQRLMDGELPRGKLVVLMVADQGAEPTGLGRRKDQGTYPKYQCCLRTGLQNSRFPGLCLDHVEL